MRKFLWLEIVCVLCVFSGCKSTHNNYPGYTAVGSDGAGRSYYIDLQSLQSRSGLVQLSLLTEYRGKDYAIFRVTTNCHGMLKRLSGTRYGADGSIIGDVAGDTNPLQMDKAPELSPAVAMACKRASEMRYFAGRFDPSKALYLLFGNYNQENRTATWSDVQERVSAFQGTQGIVSPYFDSDYSDHGIPKHVLLTSTVPDSEYTCHACSPVVSAFVFANRDGKWFPESEKYDVQVSSSWGKPPTARLVRIGPDAHGIVLSVGDMHQGDSFAEDSILVPSSAGLHVALQLTTEADNGGNCGGASPGSQPCFQMQATYEFVRGRSAAFYDVVVTENGTELSSSGQVIPASGNKRYSYANGKYEPATEHARS
ncbi:MAG TPA: hypothetical protein VFQ00_06370 [Terriglobales bacterium]|nr:hypothetical protein [Terriglobales bacterium]